jgi:TIR domain
MVEKDNVEARKDFPPLRVFVSYSHDSDEHKKWVLALVKRLRNDGIDAIVDEMHLTLGAYSPEFMERAVRESGRVLVACTEKYKQRFDNREGGAGYEGHIITGEIVNEVGKNKFIPILRQGDWKTATPTALSGMKGIDLRNEATTEYQKLIKNLYNVSPVTPIGSRPKWLDDSNVLPDRSISEIVEVRRGSDRQEFAQQRKKLPETDLLRKIWSKPHWHIWIHPTEFKKARFQTVEQCRQFVLSSEVIVTGWFAYPSFSTDALELGEEWVAGEIEHSQRYVSRAERWALFRSGQFTQNRSVDEIAQLGDKIHVLEILDTTTAAFEFASRMASQRILAPEALFVFELRKIDGRQLTWPQDVFGDIDAVPRNCWCQDEILRIEKQLTVGELKTRKREVALEVALEIYGKFGWSDPPVQLLKSQQDKRFGFGVEAKEELVMKLGDRVRVKLQARVENEFRGKTGTIDANVAPGGVVLVSFDDEAVAHQFLAEDLELIS